MNVPAPSSLHSRSKDKGSSGYVGGFALSHVKTRKVTWSVGRTTVEGSSFSDGRALGSQPVVLLLHGLGAAKHSWHTLVPLLAKNFCVIAPDLPGHGDSEVIKSNVMSLPAMAKEVAELLDVLGVKPALVVGHSAGAALAVRMVADKLVEPAAVVSINGAFMTYGGAIGGLLAPLAGMFSASTFVTENLARKARDPRAVERVIAGTGSHLDDSAIARYSTVLQKPSHLKAVFAMMANWDLETLRRAMRRLTVPLHLFVADNDTAVDPGQAQAIAKRCSAATITHMPNLGHLAHEERPELVARLILDNVDLQGAL